MDLEAEAEILTFIHCPKNSYNVWRNLMLRLVLRLTDLELKKDIVGTSFQFQGNQIADPKIQSRIVEEINAFIQKAVSLKEVVDDSSPKYAPLDLIISELTKLREIKDFTFNITKITDESASKLNINIEILPNHE